MPAVHPARRTAVTAIAAALYTCRLTRVSPSGARQANRLRSAPVHVHHFDRFHTDAQDPVAPLDDIALAPVEHAASIGQDGHLLLVRGLVDDADEVKRDRRHRRRTWKSDGAGRS